MDSVRDTLTQIHSGRIIRDSELFDMRQDRGSSFRFVSSRI